jgi:hypothetical protein
MLKSFRFIGGIFTSLLLLNSANIYGQSSKVTQPEIIEVYGNFAQDLNSDQIAWLHNQLERSEVKKQVYQEHEKLPLLSGVPVINKYTNTLKKDNFTEPLKINPLKYAINFMDKNDQTFRIDSTDYVLFVKGKK